MIRKILSWFGVVTFVLCALGAFSMGGIVSGIILLLIAFVCSPYRYLLLNLLPEKLKKTSMVIVASVVLFFASMLGMPTDSSADLNTETVEEVADSITDLNERTMSSALNEDEAEDSSSKSAKVEDDTQNVKEDDAANKTAEKSDDKKATEDVTATQKKTEDAAAKKPAEDAAAKKAAEDAAAKKAAEDAAAQKAAEEAAAQKAAEAAAVAQAASQVDSSTVANGTESPNALAVLQMGPTTGNPCWVPRNGGKKYHSNSSCSGMDNPIYTTIDTATACGFDACKKCH